MSPRSGDAGSHQRPKTIGSLLPIARAIRGIRPGHPVRVGIDGFCAAGKTTAAEELAAELSDLSVIRASTDDFQSPPPVRWQLGERSPVGFYRHAIDFDALKRELLLPLGPGGNLLHRTSTYDIHELRPNLSPVTRADPGAVVIVDGLFLHAHPLRGCWDFTVFVDVSFEHCIRRAVVRNQERQADLESLRVLYEERYVPGFQLYVGECDPRATASVTWANPDR